MIYQNGVINADVNKIPWAENCAVFGFTENSAAVWDVSTLKQDWYKAAVKANMAICYVIHGKPTL